MSNETEEVNVVDEEPTSPEVRAPSPQFEPIVCLPEVIMPVLEEEEEDVLFVMRAKLFRFESSCIPPEWKERGTGDLKILQHRTNSTHRIIMRRDKTHKVCANHFIQPWMKLSHHGNNEKTWIWSVHADYADEQISSEVLAVRFASPEKAAKFKEVFEQCCKCDDDPFNASLEGSYLNSTKDDAEENEEQKETKEKGSNINGTKDDEKKETKENGESEESQDLEKKLREVTLEEKE